ncbi:MAG: ABC transporter ATP-binding protein [Patescibacteria group bacterium]
MENIITVKNLKKAYGSLKAVDNISFEVKKGEIFGLLGENGAGKTTTLEMIEGLRKPTSGEIKVLNFDIRHDLSKIKHIIGVQLQSSAYFGFLTLVEILDLFGSFYQKTVNPMELLELVDLKDKAKSYINNLSGGQRQRFSIVASLVNDPQIVFLDEPTTGLDPIARRNLWDLIIKIKAQGKTIVLTTHYMEEAEILCDRIGIMDSGKIVALDKTHNLIEKVKHPYKIHFITPNLSQKSFDALNKIGILEELAGKSHHYELRLHTKHDLNDSLSLVQKTDPESLSVGRASLEDVFIELTGKTLKD